MKQDTQRPYYNTAYYNTVLTQFEDGLQNS